MEEIEKSLLDLGYEKQPFEVFGITKFRYEKNGIAVNLTSAEEGKAQIQGNATEDLFQRGKCSKFYTDIEDLVRIFKPERIVDSGFNEHFVDLTRSEI